MKQRQTYDQLRRNRAQFQSQTGLSLEIFDKLFPYFESARDEYNNRFTTMNKERIRPPRQYKNRVFEETASMLVFILFCLKTNSLQETQAAMFGMNQPQANRRIHLLKQILMTALQHAESLPCRDFDCLQKYLHLGQDLLLDGSERPVPRPADGDVQKEFYSEKKTHTVKNILITDMSNRVLYLSPAYEGKEHDKTICDEEQIRFDIPVVLWEDSGFPGLNPDNADVKRPVKKQKQKELLAEEKEFNRKISSKRVKVEHAIGQCKILRIVKEEIRAFKDNFRDFCMILACAINNFKIESLKT